MNNSINRILVTITLVFTLGAVSNVNAQDAHFSQYDALPVLLNPASTGMLKNTDMRIGAIYRNQWSSLATNFNTFAISFDAAFNDRWGFGAVMINDDEANVINNFSFAVSSAYQISDPNQSNYVLSAGVQLGFIYKRINTDQLIFDNQYDGYNFDSDLPTGETFDRSSRFMPDVNFGFSYVSTERNQKVNPYGQFSVFHITSPNESMIGSVASKLPLKWVVNGGAKIEINRELVLDPSILFMMQRQGQMIYGNLIAYYNLQQTPFTVLGGLSYRHQDAIAIHAGLKHNFNIFRISYDVNTSGLSEYSNNRGALEFSVIYQPGSRASRSIY